MTPKVSVIVPVDNKAPYLRACLDSIGNQTLKEIEIICVNDSPSDESIEIIKEYQAKDSRIKSIIQKNKGLGMARNAGMNVATGDYLICFDADDFIEYNMLEYLYYIAKKEQSDVVICGFYRYDNRSQEDIQINYPHVPETVISPFQTEILKENLFNITDPNAWTKLWKTDLIKRENLYYDDFPYAEDVSFTCLALACSKKISFTNIPFVHYRYFRKGQKTFENKNLIFLLKALGSLYTSLCQKKLYELYKESYFLRLRASFGWELSTTSLDKKKDLILIPQILPPKIVQEFFSPKDGPAVSIIVPVYNMEKYLPQCLDSLVSQTLKNIEIICVDDGSTDSSLKILQDYAAKDNRIKILTQPNSHQSIARRNAMKVATGEYVLYVDSDDYIELATCECLYLYSKLFDLDMCSFMAIEFKDDSKEEFEMPYHRLLWLPDDFPPVFSRINIENVMPNIAVSSGLTFYKVAFLKEKEIEWIKEPLYYEDNLFFTKALLCAERVGALKETFLHRRVHSKSTTSNDADHFSDWCVITPRLLELIKKYGNDFLMNNYLNYEILVTWKKYQDLSELSKIKYKDTFYSFCKKLKDTYLFSFPDDIKKWYDSQERIEK